MLAPMVVYAIPSRMIAKSMPSCQWPGRDLQSKLEPIVSRCCTCSKSAANTRLSVVEPGRPRLCNAGRSARLGRVFEFLQAPVEIAGIDRPDKGVDHRRDPLRLSRRDRPTGQRRGDRRHRRGDVVGLQPTGFVPWGRLDRRQGEFYGALAARRQYALEAKPHRGRVAGESELDRPARQRLGLTRQKCCGGLLIALATTWKNRLACSRANGR